MISRAVLFLLYAVISTGWGILPQPEDVRLDADQCRPVRQLRFLVARQYWVYGCPILFKMIDRNTKIINRERQGESKLVCAGQLDPIDTVKIEVDYCTSQFVPITEMNESYTITIPRRGDASISAQTVWGINYGLQTLSQLIVRSQEPFTYVGVVHDSPRYKYRGLMLDTAGHFLQVGLIKQHLDAMSFCKLNVLHWHIVDDESFAYQSANRPDLSQQGAFHPLYAVYSPGDIAEIADYAKALGIRLILEMDSPGHTKGWGRSILTKCEESDGDVYESVNPANEAAWSTLKTILEEFILLNPSRYLHLGGDEVNTTCWRQNKNVSALMAKLGIEGNYDKLLEYYIKRMALSAQAVSNVEIILWDDILASVEQVPHGSIIQVWSENPKWEKIAAQNLSYIYSACFYLNHISYGDDWKAYYGCNLDVLPNATTMLGGEACMWAEYVDDSNSLSRTWPRAAAVAERLWTRSLQSGDTIVERMHEFTCLLKRRGIPAQQADANRHCPYAERCLNNACRLQALEAD